MVWCKIGDREFDHPRWERIEVSHGVRAWADCAAVWMVLGTASTRRLGELGGVVPDHHVAGTDLRRLPAVETGIAGCLAILVDVGLLEVTGLSVAPYRFSQEWRDEQPTSDEVARKRDFERDKKRAKRERERRERLSPGGQPEGTTPRDDPRGVPPGCPADPDPDPDPGSDPDPKTKRGRRGKRQDEIARWREAARKGITDQLGGVPPPWLSLHRKRFDAWVRWCIDVGARDRRAVGVVLEETFAQWRQTRKAENGAAVPWDLFAAPAQFWTLGPAPERDSREPGPVVPKAAPQPHPQLPIEGAGPLTRGR